MFLTNCVLMLNWFLLNGTDYLHKNGFGINKPNQRKMRTIIEKEGNELLESQVSTKKEKWGEHGTDNHWKQLPVV